jgi:acyl-CoA reductase-like NAD-dependent aldehyde dehydrogenase
MAPWNAPTILGVRCFALPIACGNTVVMKASEKCPGLHRLLGDVMADAGLPAGVLNILTHETADAPEVVNALIDHPLTRRINFTGSTRVGRIIAERAARHLKPCLLELGGKASPVVLDDADLDGAVNAARFGAFMNQGQICMSTEKVVVDEKIADAFAEKFAESARGMKVGPPTDQVHIGSVVDRETVEHVGTLVEDAVAKGAKVLCGGVPVTRHMPSRSPRTSRPASVTSTARPCSTRRRCPSAASRPAGVAVSGGMAGINEFTELRWITIEDPAQGYPI